MTDFNIRKIFQSEYSIPIYQRAFAWTEEEITTLIDDVYDYYKPKGIPIGPEEQQNYYIGSLVIHSDHEGVISVIDGQQRLTTLSLIICYLKNETTFAEITDEIDITLNFESRKRSTDIFRNLKNKDNFKKVLDLDNELVDGYRTIQKKFQEKIGSNSESKFDQGYFEYLLNHVILIKNELPKETDLNHYFEIMNNRGEQLEKHEIVKSYLLGLLSPDSSKERSVMSEIWNACQQMDKYVQLGFKTDSKNQKNDIRGKLFSDTWDKFVPTDFTHIVKSFPDSTDSSVVKSIPLTEILERELFQQKEIDESDDTGRYHSIINFPNFLLHVLKLFIDKEKFDWSNESQGVSLDDKKLVEQFKQYIHEKNVKNFMYLLLKTRFIFDNYIIKTDSVNDNSSDDSNWSLHKPYMLNNHSKRKLSPRNTFFNDDSVQNTLVKIESMFQVTDPRQIYKNFLFGLLQILSEDGILDNKELLVNQLIVFSAKRFVALTKDKSVFDRGVDTPNYIFNFLDFVLWYQNEIENKNRKINSSDFEFKYRNSVEHFYPQNPNEGEDHKKLQPEVLNNFGNLCIMARGSNSMRSNLMPVAKIKEFKSTDQSLKFELMVSLVDEENVWSKDQIMAHGEEMKKILSEFVEKIRKQL